MVTFRRVNFPHIHVDKNPRPDEVLGYAEVQVNSITWDSVNFVADCDTISPAGKPRYNETLCVSDIQADLDNGYIEVKP